MLLPLTGIVHFVNSLMIYACYLKLNATYKNMLEKDETLKYLLWFVLYVGVFQFLMGIGHLPILFGMKDAFYYTFNAGYIVGHVFLYVAEAYIVLVPMSLYLSRKNYEKYGRVYSRMLLMFGGAITVINLLLPAGPVFDERTGVTVFNVNSLVAGLIPVITLMSIGYAGIIFLIKSSKLQGSAKIKAIILGVGMIIIVIGGPMHETAENIAEYFIADFLIVLAFFIITMGIYYEQLNTNSNKAK